VRKRLVGLEPSSLQLGNYVAGLRRSSCAGAHRGAIHRTLITGDEIERLDGEGSVSG
jgi:hypothetical protein